METSSEAKRLRTAIDLFDAGVRLMSARLRRSRPDASAAELEDLLQRWLLERPGAEQGDAVGRSITWPRVP